MEEGGGPSSSCQVPKAGSRDRGVANSPTVLMIGQETGTECTVRLRPGTNEPGYMVVSKVYYSRYNFLWTGTSSPLCDV